MNVWKGLTLIALVFSAAGPFAGVLLVREMDQQSDQADRQIQTQRAEAIELLCDLEVTFERFVEGGPELPRDRVALDRLRRLNCGGLLQDIASPPP